MQDNPIDKEPIRAVDRLCGYGQPDKAQITAAPAAAPSRATAVDDVPQSVRELAARICRRPHAAKVIAALSSVSLRPLADSKDGKAEEVNT